MEDRDDVRIVFGSRLVSASGFAETADRLERSMWGSLDGAGRAAAAGGPDRPGGRFDVEFAGLVDLAQGAFGGAAERLRGMASKHAQSETNFAQAEESSWAAVNPTRAL
ncbi:hypothetical protein AB0F17_05335 [Nonomuraea sp. NPDC026600]|uniref:hypothetical protein n=1 Tax=Nonomuraea sp. NPDC026600 TaxID=3155363 RepID=UPI0033D830EF